MVDASRARDSFPGCKNVLAEKVWSSIKPGQDRSDRPDLCGAENGNTKSGKQKLSWKASDRI